MHLSEYRITIGEYTFMYVDGVITVNVTDNLVRHKPVKCNSQKEFEIESMYIYDEIKQS